MINKINPRNKDNVQNVSNLETNSDNISGFKWIITIYRLYGISFCGASVGSNKLSLRKTILLIAWNLVFMILYFVSVYLLIDIKMWSIKKTSHNESKFLLILFITKLSIIIHFSEIGIIYIIYMFKGSHILKSMKIKIIAECKIDDKYNFRQKNLGKSIWYQKIRKKGIIKWI